VIMSQNQSNTRQKHEIIDELILDQIKNHPEKNINQIGSDFSQVGIYKHPVSVANRLTQSDYLRMETTKLKEKSSENVLRYLFPLTFKRVQKALRNKDLDDKAVFPYIKLVWDKTLGEDFQGIINQTINIKSLQAIIGKAMDR
jgi:hypothetical protein